MTNQIQDYGLSNDAIKSIASAEQVIGGLKDINKDNVQQINEKKIDQYVGIICHVAQFKRTKSDNLSKAVTSTIYDDLMNHCGISKANSKLLKENSVKYCAKFDVPSQVTETYIRDHFAELGIDTQTKLVAEVNDKKELTLAEKISKMVYGADKTKKVDGIEETIFVPTDLSMDDIQAIEDHMADIKRVRIATDKANAEKLSETIQDNQETNEVLDALVG
jgi:hypothetical protein|tara:strand:+ start:41 stop:700 length:660 start_codon:yes stop_codon:yes gene_type:complete